MGGIRRAGAHPPQRGQATVELALSSVVLLLLLFGLLDLARGFYFAVRLQDAARAGARTGAYYNVGTGTYDNLDLSGGQIKSAVDLVLTQTGIPASTLAATTCPATTNGNAQYNPPYQDSDFPASAADPPILYVCYDGTQGEKWTTASGSPAGKDLEVVVLYQFGFLSGFLQNQLGVASVHEVGLYHAQIP